MTKVNKNLTDVPQKLRSQVVEKAFIENIKHAKFSDKNNKYQAAKEDLIAIYGKKCAYCEQKLWEIGKHVEHYRPKATYYWLAYSWDNLLLSCPNCNGNKGSKFPLAGKKIKYNNEQFADIHVLGAEYDKIENPKIINPEKEGISGDIVFDRLGQMSSANEKIQFNIEKIFILNRDELLEKRVIVINDFVSWINLCIDMLMNSKKDNAMQPIIRKCADFKNGKEFSVMRKFFVANLNVLFEDARQYKIVQAMFAGC